MREWFAEVQRRLDVGSDPFQEPAAAGRTDADGGGGGAARRRKMAPEEQTGAGDEDDEDEEEEDDDGGGGDTDDSEVWEPSRSVRKSLSISED